MPRQSKTTTTSAPAKDPRKQFVETAELRVSRALKSIRLVARAAQSDAYTKEDVELIRQALAQVTDETLAKFQPGHVPALRNGFSLQANRNLVPATKKGGE